jgi:hypothetical protein
VESDGQFSSCSVNDVHTTNLFVENFTGGSVSFKEVSIDKATIDYLTTTVMTGGTGAFQSIVSDSLQTNQLNATNANVGLLTGGSMNVVNVVALTGVVQNMTATNVTVNNLITRDMTVDTFAANEAYIQNFQTNSLVTASISANTVQAATINSNFINADFISAVSLDTNTLTTNRIDTTSLYATSSAGLNMGNMSVGVLQAEITPSTGTMLLTDSSEPGMICAGPVVTSDLYFQDFTGTSTGVTGPIYLTFTSDVVSPTTMIPLIQGYNLEISSLDNQTAFGNQSAILSLCNRNADASGHYRTLRFQNNGNLAIYGATNNPIFSTNTQVSDMTLKTNVTRIENPMDILNELEGFYFYFNNGIDDQRHAGISAQKALQVFPECVQTEEDTTHLVHLEKLVPVLIEAIKEIDARLTVLEEQ